jgi:hypothetical protein
MTRHAPRAAVAALVALFVPLTAALAGPAVTVYTHDLGYVRETRALELTWGDRHHAHRERFRAG